MEIFKTKNASETEKLGFQLGNDLRQGHGHLASLLYSIEAKISGALILYLSGDLGSGKTTFVKGLAKGLGIKERITSPTYVFARSYQFPSFKIEDQIKNKFYHLDLYRLDGPNDRVVLNSIEFQEIINDPSAIIAIEWAGRLNQIYSEHAVEIIFSYAGDRDRSVIFKCDNI